VLSRATAVCAALFMVGAIVLGIMGQRGPGGSVIGGRSAPPAPAGSEPVETSPFVPEPASSPNSSN
jgi:preprotein translocase subunit SecG